MNSLFVLYLIILSNFMDLSHGPKGFFMFESGFFMLSFGKNFSLWPMIPQLKQNIGLFFVSEVNPGSSLFLISYVHA